MTVTQEEYAITLRRAFEEHYEEASDVWSNDLAMRAFPSVVQGLLKLPFRTRVLDVGCGNGDDLEYFAKVFSNVVGVDLVEHENWSALSGGYRNISFHESSFLSLENLGEFDLILDNGCFHHQHPDDYISYLEKIKISLDRLGWLVMSTFKSNVHTELIDSKGRLHRYFSDSELEDLLGRAGFSMHESIDLFRVGPGDYYRLSFLNLSKN